MNKKEILKAFGARVKSMRKAKAITQANLAESIGKTRYAIQRLEAGNVDPSYHYVCELAKELDIPLEVLIDISHAALGNTEILHLT